VPATTRSTKPCVICGRIGEPSKEHVVGRRVRDALGTRGLVREYSGTTYVGAAEALAIVLHGVCVTCNRGWLEYLDRNAWPVLEPILLGAAPGTVLIIDPADQAALAAWAVKVSLLLFLSKFRDQDNGWIPASTLDWLYQNHHSCMPPPGSRVWMGGLKTSEVPASAQAACLTDAQDDPVAHCGTFSVGNVVFQVFCCEQEDAALSPDNETWLEPRDLYTLELLQIAPAAAPLRWPPEVVFTVDDLRPLAERLRQGLPARP
jgi:hypothetical protein